MSKIFKASRVILDQKSFVLTNTLPEIPIQEERKIQDHVELKDFEDEVVFEETEEEKQLRLEKELEDYRQKRLEDAHEEANQIIQSAEEEAKRLLEKYKEQAEEEGFEVGLQKGKEEYSLLIQEAHDIKNQWIEERKNLLREAESEIVQLILTSVEKIIHKKCHEDSQVIESLVKEGLRRIIKTENLVLRVSSEDYEKVMELKPMIEAMADKVERIDIKSDSNLPIGSCHIDGDFGEVDTSVQVQFEELKNIFISLLTGE